MIVDVTGNLTIQPLCAKLTRDVQTIGQMECYCSVQIGTHTHRTKVNAGGRNPHWEEIFVVRRTSEDVVRISVWNFHSLRHDTIVGEGSIPMSRVLSGQRWEDWVDLFHNAKKAGEVKIGFLFIPDEAHHHRHHSNPNLLINPQNTNFPAYPNPYVNQYPPQAFPQNAPYPPQGVPQAYPPQAYPPQAYPPQAYPPQGLPVYANQGEIHHHNHYTVHRSNTYTDGLPSPYPPLDYPPVNYPPVNYPPQNFYQNPKNY